jgi:hypothetical protein
MLSESTSGELLDHNPQNVPISLSGLFGHVGSAEHPEDLTVQPEVTKLTPQQRTYVSLRVRGFSSAAACRQLNLNLMAAHRWSNSQWFEAACEEERTKWLIQSGIDKRVELMVPLMGLALDALKSGLTSEDERIRLLAVDKVFATFFGDEKRPVGRPPKPKSDDSDPITLSDIQERSQQRVNLLKATNQDHIDLRANA